ncbi:hypothetical protein Drorol1_Dr00018802 [Drosera rotundifolia]
MDTICSVSPAVVLPPPTPLLHLRRFPTTRAGSATHRLVHLSTVNSIDRISTQPFPRRRSGWGLRCRVSDGDAGEDEEGEVSGEDDVDVERALQLDGTIPGSSDEFVKQVSSRAYDMRRNLIQTLDSSSYDVLEVNPWRETSKPLYVLTHKQNQLCTMRTRRNRSEVVNELGMLFSKSRKWGSDFGNQPKQSRTGTKFEMFVEDVREGILVFEDENEAMNYCNLLQGGGQGCEGVAEIEASSVFDLCKSTRALAVLFRKGRTPPQPERLQLNLRARNHSLED